jgi:(p)ppGpp synthase/HD superfamily hydrolase
MNRADKLLIWIEQRHEGHLIRRTAEPYINHLVAVAKMTAVIPLGYEIGLCHDLFEETGITEPMLHSALTSFGYTGQEASLITNCTIELTDVFTKKAYPDLKKEVRKKKEATRLATISATAQTIKCGDLIYNIGWILKYDLKHARKYLKKKKSLLAYMTSGEQHLRQATIKTIDDALRFVKNYQNKR